MNELGIFTSMITTGAVKRIFNSLNLNYEEATQTNHFLFMEQIQTAKKLMEE